MQATRVLDALLDISRIVGLPQTTRTRTRPRPIVGVVQPATRRVQKMGSLVYVVQSLPIRRRVRAIHWLREIERLIPAWNEVAVEVRDVPIRIGIDRIVGRVRLELHRLQVL